MKKRDNGVSMASMCSRAALGRTPEFMVSVQVDKVVRKPALITILAASGST
ncbi:hypothetical protein SAZ10_15735 [Mesorhizobium sp. BAC0120]|nr:hypothetical protein [Mesorhizobium sp. BAC0120]MDW6023209.1 hypothetical protein [Mesorhizobium sp. BAC0120]